MSTSVEQSDLEDGTNNSQAPEKVKQQKKSKKRLKMNKSSEAALPKEVMAMPGSSTGYLYQLASNIPTDMLPLDEYLPEFVKDYASGGPVTRADTLQRDKIRSVKFQIATLYDRNSQGRCLVGKQSLVVLVGYSNGFQIWDATDDKSMLEVASVRGDWGPVSICQFLEEPRTVNGENPESARINLARPLVAVCSAEDSASPAFSPNDVKLYSLNTHKVIQELKFESQVLGVRSNDKFVAVSLLDKIVGFCSHTLEHRFLVECYPCPIGDSIFALSDRWIAYPGAQQVVGAPEDVDYCCDSNQELACASPGRAPDSGDLQWGKNISSAAREIAAGMYYLGDLGMKKLEERKNSTTTTATTTKSETSGVGTVVVRDLITNVTIANFKSHDSPLVLLEFDPTGSLLVSSSLDGHIINVHRILPRNAHDLGAGITQQTSSPSHRLLYRLNRGITRALIRDVSFSSDLKWLAVTSARGTAHIFPISPCGGPTSTFTHLVAHPGKEKQQNGWKLRERIASLSSSLTGGSPNTGTSSPISTSLGSTSSQGEPAQQYQRIMPAFGPSLDGAQEVHTIKALARVRQKLSPPLAFQSSSPKSDSKEETENIPAAVCSIFRGGFLNVVSSGGMMQQYELIPTTGEKDQRELCLQTNPTHCWDMCRRSSWPEWRQSIISSRPYPRVPQRCYHNKLDDDKQRAEWLSNVEIHTHASPLTHIWATPQFRFRTMDLENVDEIFIEKIPTQLVPVRGAGPTPTFNGTLVESTPDWAEEGEELTLDDIRNAIATPAQFQDLYIPDDQDIDQHILVFDDDLSETHNEQFLPEEEHDDIEEDQGFVVQGHVLTGLQQPPGFTRPKQE